MKLWWATQSTRINALSLRERVFLFLSVLASGMALADVIWLSPAQVAHKQLTQRFEKQSMELQRARSELTTVARPVDTSKAVRDEIAVVRHSLELINLNIKEAFPVTTDATPLARAMVQLLRRHEGLTLVRTSAVAPDTAGAGAIPAAVARAGVPPAGLTRQGVELTVSGSYHALTRYVEALEKALPQVRWGTMTLKSEKQPPELTLQLFLLGVQR